MSIDLRAASDRFHTDLGWLDSHHSFSFGHHHDPDNVSHGLLIVANDDIVAPGGGFGTHPHRDMEIVTWVLDGELEHRDSEGNEGVIYPGLAQRMSAGRGITHSEMNHSKTDPVHFVQMWVVPDTTGIDPGYEQLDVNDALDAGGLVPVASGKGHAGAIAIHQRGATMSVARLTDGETVELDAAPYTHVFVASGSVTIDSATLGRGDAARLTDTAATVTARPEGARAEDNTPSPSADHRFAAEGPRARAARPEGARAEDNTPSPSADHRFAAEGLSEIIVWQSDHEVNR